MVMPAVEMQPTPTAPLESHRASNLGRVKDSLLHFKDKATTKEGWVGDYDYTWLCKPTLPFLRRKGDHMPPFYGLNDDLPLLLAITSGLQHALAMLAGLITPPIIFASALNLDAETSSYMISASLIGCGILSLVQMSRLHLFRGYYLGTGLITVVGTSFATLSTANAVRPVTFHILSAC